MRNGRYIEVKSPILVGLILTGLGLLFINFPSGRPMGSEAWGWAYLILGIIVFFAGTTKFIRK